MRWFLLVVVFLVLPIRALAAGPDEQFVDIYNEILQAQNMETAGPSPTLAQRYREALGHLQQLQTEYPDWNPQVVKFRLEFLQEKLAKLGKFPPAADATNIATNAAPDQTATLRSQIDALNASNAQLQQKLQEGISFQPPVTSQELVQARQKIEALQKENALLKVTLDQQKPAANQATNVADSLTNTAVAAQEQSARLSQEVDVLRARLGVLEASPVPYTAEELAILKQPASISPAVSAPVPHVAHSSKELPPGAGPLMADATLAMREHDFKGAEEKYSEILSQDENNVFVLARLAAAQYESGDLAVCEKTVLRALNLDPDDPGCLYLLGILRYRQDRLDDALTALTHSAQGNPTNASTQNYLGIVLSEKGQRAAAETAFRKALQVDPESADAHYNLALVYASENPPSIELARWHYKRALDLGHPKNEPMEKLLAPKN
jgi:tetratricopeptide (TPR) repeat protein